jgi:hypothetical protein
MSGGNDNAAKEAQRAQERKDAAIKNTQARVNAVFDSPERAADLADFVSALREQRLGQLSEAKQTADRDLRFSLARGGQIGGSVQRDRNTELGEAYTRGLIDTERAVQGERANIEAADQDARARLIQLATSGLDATTAATQASQALRSNLQAGQSTAQAKGVGDVFASFADFAKQSREAQQRRQALYDANRNIYGPSAATAFNYGG